MHTLQGVINSFDLGTLPGQLRHPFGTVAITDRVRNLHNLHVVTTLQCYNTVITHLVQAAGHFIQPGQRRLVCSHTVESRGPRRNRQRKG